MPKRRGPGPRSSPDGQERVTLVERIERLTALPALVAAVAYLAAFAIGYLPGASDELKAGAQAVENAIVALFAAELLVRVVAAERRVEYLRRHWLDALIVVVPFLRPLRLLRAVRVLVVLARGLGGLRLAMGRYRGAYVIVVGLAATLLSAGLVALFEAGSGGSIRGFPDALWWAATTVTTVGYGDAVPATPEGRAVAVFLMVVGIALFGTLTAGIAAYFVESGSEAPGTGEAEVARRLAAIELQLAEHGRILSDLAGRLGVPGDAADSAFPGETPSATPDSGDLQRG